MRCPIHGNIVYCEMADLRHHMDAVNQDELILCDLGISHRLSSVEAMIVSAWHNAARKSRISAGAITTFKRRSSANDSRHCGSRGDTHGKENGITYRETGGGDMKEYVIQTKILAP